MARTVDVTIPAKLRKKANNAKIVTCKWYGGGRAEQVQTARSVRMMERTERMGSKMGDLIREHEERQQKRLPAGDGVKPDPMPALLAVHPPDLVCSYCVGAVNALPVRSEHPGWPDGADWAMDVHPDVLEHITRHLLKVCDWVPETEEQRGEGSGGSSAP